MQISAVPAAPTFDGEAASGSNQEGYMYTSSTVNPPAGPRHIRYRRLIETNREIRAWTMTGLLTWN